MQQGRKHGKLYKNGRNGQVVGSRASGIAAMRDMD